MPEEKSLNLVVNRTIVEIPMWAYLPTITEIKERIPPECVEEFEAAILAPFGLQNKFAKMPDWTAHKAVQTAIEQLLGGLTERYDLLSSKT